MGLVSWTPYTLLCVWKCAYKLGTPTQVHPVVAQTWGTFAKLKINIDVTFLLKSRVEVIPNSTKIYEVFIHYEKIQKTCLYCGLIGHEIQTCDKRNSLLNVLQFYPDYLRTSLIHKLDPKLDSWMYMEQHLPNSSNPTIAPVTNTPFTPQNDTNNTNNQYAQHMSPHHAHVQFTMIIPNYTANATLQQTPYLFISLGPSTTPDDIKQMQSFYPMVPHITNQAKTHAINLSSTSMTQANQTRTKGINKQARARNKNE